MGAKRTIQRATIIDFSAQVEVFLCTILHNDTVAYSKAPQNHCQRCQNRTRGHCLRSPDCYQISLLFSNYLYISMNTYCDDAILILKILAFLRNLQKILKKYYTTSSYLFCYSVQSVQQTVLVQEVMGKTTVLGV